MTALDDLLKKTAKPTTGSSSAKTTSGGNNLDALLTQVKSGKYQAPNSGYITGTPPPTVAGTSTQTPTQQPQQSAISSFLTGVTQLAQKYIPQLNPSTAPQPITPATFQNPNQISNQVLGQNQPIKPINPQLFNESSQSITSAKPVTTPMSTPKPLDFSQPAQAKLRSTMYDISAAEKKAQQSVGEALTSAREWLNKNIGDIQLVTRGNPVPLEQAGNTDKNASPYFADRNQQSIIDFNNSALSKANRGTNIFLGNMAKGLTGGILKPTSEAPVTVGEKVLAQVADTMGSLTAMKGIGKVLDGFVAGSETIGNFIEKFPTASKYLIPFAKGAGTLDIYGQLDPDIKNRFQKLLVDTAIAIPLAAMGTQGKAFSVPASFGMGWGLAKLNGADNQDSLIAGTIFATLDGAGKLGDRNMIDKAMADRAIKTESFKILNEYADTPLNKNSSPAEIRKAYINAVKQEHPDVGGNAETFKSVVAAYEFLTGKNIHPDFTQGTAATEAKKTENQPVQQLTSGEAKPSEIVKTAPAPQEKSSFSYTPDTKLSLEAKTVEKKFGDYLTNNLPEAEKTYTEKFGNVLNTDNARELSPDYNANRSALSPAVHEPASAFIKQLYEKQLTQPAPEGKLDKVLFTAGGTGAGKTTALGTTPEFKNSVDKSQIVYDTNLSSFDSSKQKIDQALAADKNVQIVYVSRDPVDAMMNGAVPRAVRMGRTVPVDVHIGTHIKSLQTIQKLEYLYKDNPQVQIRVIDNSHGKGNAVEVPIDSLKNISYDKASLTDKIKNELKTQYEQGKISKDIYQGFTGEKSTSGISQVSKPNDQSNGQKPQQSNEKSVVPTENKQPKTAEIPHKENYSRFQERMESQLLDTNGEKYNWDSTTQKYNKVDLKKDAQKALDLLQSDPEKALRIAQGLEPSEKGSALEFDVANAVALKAFDEGNTKLGTDIINRLSQKATRYGQEISSLRGNFNDNTPQHYMKELITRRMDKLGSTLVSTAEKSVKLSNKTKVTEKIDREVEKLAKQMKTERSRIKLAQDIIDSLTCK